MEHQLTLYHYWRSSCSWRVRWALAYKDIAYETVAVNLLAGEQRAESYLARNPMGTVPCLVVDGRPIGESLAILEWIEETYPKPALLPQSALERAWVRQVSLSIVAGTQPLQNLGAMRKFSSDEGEQKKWARHWITQGLGAVERLLDGKSGDYCLGDRLTFADLCLIPQMRNAYRFEADVEKLPRCRRVYEHCQALESCKVSAPERWQPS